MLTCPAAAQRPPAECMRGEDCRIDKHFPFYRSQRIRHLRRKCWMPPPPTSRKWFEVRIMLHGAFIPQNGPTPKPLMAPLVPEKSLQRAFKLERSQSSQTKISGSFSLEYFAHNLQSSVHILSRLWPHIATAHDCKYAIFPRKAFLKV